MKTRAYPEIYLSSAQDHLGEAFDFAINTCKLTGDNFIKMFITSSISKHFAIGNPSYIVGRCGIELALDVIEEATKKRPKPNNMEIINPSVEYWIGWIMAYYQWYSDQSFYKIFEALSFDDLQKMYYPLHEADITKFIEVANQKMKAYFFETNLKHHRLLSGKSQSQLAKLSGVSLRSIQMYEQRNKDINKASVLTVYNLAKILNCRVEDLLEKQYLLEE